MKRELFRQIPKVDVFLKDKELLEVLKDAPRLFLVKAVRDVLDKLRSGIAAGKIQKVNLDEIREEFFLEVKKITLQSLITLREL